MHSSGFFQIKLIARLILKCEISGSHMISDQSLLLSTIVLNDNNSAGSYMQRNVLLEYAARIIVSQLVQL